MLNSCVASPHANSYVTMSEADEAMSVVDPTWASRTEAERENALKLAAQKIDRLRFVGKPVYAAQAMAFPRTADIFVHQDRIDDLVAVQPDDPYVGALTAYGFADGVLGISFGGALPAGSAGQPVEYVVDVDGVPTTYTDIAGTGEILPGVTVDYASGVLRVPAASEPVSVAATCTQAAATGTTKFQSASLIFPDTDTLPDLFVTGCVHVSTDTGRLYLPVIAHDIINGVVTVESPAPLTFRAAMLHVPVKTEVKKAQLAQLCRNLRIDGVDPLVGAGIDTIKIGDTTRKYATDRYGAQSLQAIASRNGVSVHVLLLLGYMTIYGKLTLVSQMDFDTAYGR